MGVFMMFKNDSGSVRITRRLRLCRPFFGGLVSWRWQKLLFPKKLGLRNGMNPHMMITGESGGGKSNASRVMVERLCEAGANVIVLDPNGDYLGIADSIGARVYDASRCGINILDPDGMDEEEKLAELMAIFTKRLKLGHVQASLLRKCVRYCYWVMKTRNKVPTVKDLLYTIRIFEKRAKGGEIRTLGTLFERISLLNSNSFFRSVDAEKLMKGRSIFLLSTLHTEEAQAVYMEGLLRKIYGTMLAGRCSRRTYLVIDEARKISGSRVLGRLTAEGRKYGLGVITISQRAKEIDGNVLSNSSIFLSFYQREPSELNYVANFVAGGNELGRFAEVKRAIRNLSVGEAIMLDSSQNEPVIARFGLAQSRPASLEHLILSSAAHGASINHLLRNAEANGFRGAEASAKIRSLSEEGLIKEHEIKEGRLKGLWHISYPRNSAEHDLFVNLISRKLKARGISNEIHNSSYGPDIIAYSRNGAVAIEYETGMKETAETMAMIESRKKKYAEVIVIVNDGAYEKYSGLDGVTLLRRSSFFEG